ncbi:DUF5316 domain-containing protein [Salirhabdus salicampi]|uniref:DUF5316 domain-containing protein n=1 Tax=Salirhabdus salicampi TaxID=476102 RepID=UPI0020C4E463|nr:DUF5316 domain-containing protein [Salirhabdus salicampi]MCP8615389.1 DUF5316 domain-containing protein [Salirhabdus salicampi]
MLKYFVMGIIVMAIAIGIGFYTNDWNTSLNIVGVCALVPMLFAGLLTGAFISGDRNRANYYNEHRDDRSRKLNWVKKLLLFSAPNIAVLVIVIIVGYFGM